LISQYFGFWEIFSCIFSEGIFSAFGIFMEIHLRNLTCKEKTKLNNIHNFWNLLFFLVLILNNLCIIALASLFDIFFVISSLLPSYIFFFLIEIHYIYKGIKICDFFFFFSLCRRWRTMSTNSKTLCRIEL
jgi:hypothetical protein